MTRPLRDVLFLCQFFYPENNSSATLPFDTAKHLASRGYSVGALVGYPKEYCDVIDVPMTETVDGVEISRVRYFQPDRVGAVGRIANFFSLTFRMLLRLRRLKEYKLAIVYSNPPVLPIIPLLAKKCFGTKFVFVAYDVYPEVAYASKSLTPKSVISRMMQLVNRGLYREAACVVALTDEMRIFLLHARPMLSPDRVVTIANWAHEERSAPDREAYARFGYREGQFIVSYFGNMGTVQDMETLMQAAARLKDDDRVRFLIVGHGNKKTSIEERIVADGLKNVQLLGFLTGSAFQQAVAISSCCVVSLERGVMGTVAPSKYYSYLQGGKPVLAIVEKESYLTEEIKNREIGYAVENGDASGLEAAIMNLQEHAADRIAMGERARLLYETAYAYDVAMEKYDSIVHKILAEDSLL